MFKAGSKKHLVCFWGHYIFMAEDPPDLPVYQWDGYFHLPPACATGFGCKRKVWARAQRQFWGWQEMGEVLGWLRGCLFERLLPWAACLIASVLPSFLSHEVQHFQLQRSWQSPCGGSQSLWHTILNMQLLRRSIQLLDLWLQTEAQKNHLTVGHRVPPSFSLWLRRLDL